MRLYIFVFEVLISIPLLLPKISAASAHLHETRKNKERLEDGAYSPRDSGHFENEIHHTEFDHEAILGSVRDAIEFHKLSADESKERLRKLLIKMDLNGDGFIERHELKAWILRSFKMLSDEESLAKLKNVDTNKDGKVTWKEIVKDLYGGDPKSLQVDDTFSDDKELFDVADVNNDSFLDQEEFRAYTHPEDTPRMIEVMVKQAFEKHDQDLDGHISFQEYVGRRAENEDKEWLILEKDKFDKDYDRNGDGKLDVKEAPNWLVPSNENIAHDEVDHLFGASDDDHDDKLSFDEIVNHHDIFVGSEATDFGDHLYDIGKFEDEL